jgi:hypothetical protein
MPDEPDVRASGRTSIFANPPVTVLVLLVAVRVIVLVATLQADHSGPVKDDDVLRFGQIATTAGTPYRDFQVEYMPIELVTIRAIAGDGASATASRLALLSFTCDLAAAGALWYGWGRRAAALYLLIGLPLQTFMLYRIDPLVVALAAWSMALANRDRDGPAGAMLALAVLSKLWPVVLLPWFLVSHRRRATATFAIVAGSGLLVWVLLGGLRAPWQVLTFRGAGGWAVESTVGSVVWLATGGPIRLEAGAVRTGSAPLWARALLLGVIVAIVARIWTRLRDDDADPSGAPALAAVTALVALSPLFSIQYTCWLVPWIAIAVLGAKRERTTAAFGIAIVVLGGVLAVLYGNATATIVGSIKLLLLLRNGVCVALVAYWLITGSKRRTGPAAAVV